jgi:hypothetical protein
MYPLCGRCSLRHLEDCSATPGRFIFVEARGTIGGIANIWRNDALTVGIQATRREIVLVGLQELHRSESYYIESAVVSHC